MPRTPRNSPNPPGRPPKKREAAAALAIAEKTGESIEEAARKAKVAPSTVHAHKAAGARKASRARSRAPAPPAPGSPAAELPQGGAVSTRPDLLELVRRILDARNAGARAELDDGLAVHVAGGEPALAVWLARPIARVEIDGDELDALREGLGFAVGVARSAEAGGPQLRALGIVDRLGKSISVVASRRPHVPAPDEVHEAIRGEMNTTVEQLLRHTREAAAAFNAARTDLVTWAANLGPVLGPELLRRVDAMLGGA